MCAFQSARGAGEPPRAGVDGLDCNCFRLLRGRSCVWVLRAAAILLMPLAGFAQTGAPASLPDAPDQQNARAESQQGGSGGQAQSQTQGQPTPGQAQTSAGQAGSSSSAGSGQQKKPETKEEQQKRAQQELEEQEKQRILGVVPMFNVQNNANAAPLTPKQKYQLFFKGSTDWYQFAITAIDGGLSMAGDEYAPYGQGVEGFAKYWGAAYADTFDGNFWGNAVLPSWWHEDPRYYRMGHGPFMKRVGYSALTTIWCKRDNGNWGPNYANVAGNFIGGTISNLYYPKSDRGVELTLGRGASVTYEGIVGAEIAEFWPDIAQRFMKKKATKKPAGSLEPGAGSQ
jgi:hypothetical protein